MTPPISRKNWRFEVAWPRRALGKALCTTTVKIVMEAPMPSPSRTM
jgi:hypothetical protein